MAATIEVRDLSHTYSAGTPFQHDAVKHMSFSVEKGEQGGRTFTRVVQLDRARRQQELARLSATMLEGAGELLDQAEKFKKTLA